MPGRIEGKVKLLCVKLKSNDTPDKVKNKILKGLKAAERKNTFAAPIAHPLESWHDEVHSLPDLDASDIAQVASNAKYIVFLLKDGRVCRMRCASTWDTDTKVSSELLSKSSQQLSFQVLSDAEYARQLQAEFDSLGGGGGPFASGIRTLQELERASREYMYIGSVPSPEYHRDPPYYSSLARELAQHELVTGLDSNPSFHVPLRTSPPRFSTLSSTRYSPPLSPPPSYESLIGPSQ